MKRALTLCFTLLILATAFAGAPAHAASLDDLRKSGAIGESYDGFVVVRNNVPGAAQVAAQVNAERRRIYEARAKQQRVSAAQVGQVYAAQIFRNAPAGTWFRSRDGSWKRK